MKFHANIDGRTNTHTRLHDASVFALNTLFLLLLKGCPNAKEWQLICILISIRISWDDIRCERTWRRIQQLEIHCNIALKLWFVLSEPNKVVKRYFYHFQLLIHFPRFLEIACIFRTLLNEFTSSYSLRFFSFVSFSRWKSFNFPQKYIFLFWYRCRSFT